MPIIGLYLLLAILTFSINVAPGFMPPTWMLLAFFKIHYHLDLFTVVIIGASCATLGRITLAALSQRYLRTFLSKKSKQNVDMLGKFFNKHTKLSIPLLITYAFFPIPSNNVYIAAGIAKINIRILALSFFVGRLISYTFWVAATHKLATSLEGIFQAEYANISGLVIELLSFLLIYVIIKIPWATILSQLDTKLAKKKK